MLPLHQMNPQGDDVQPQRSQTASGHSDAGELEGPAETGSQLESHSEVCTQGTLQSLQRSKHQPALRVQLHLCLATTAASSHMPETANSDRNC